VGAKMPISFSDYFQINQKVYERTLAFDPILDIDSKFFINFHLLKKTQVPQLHDSFQKVRNSFVDIIKLLSQSTSKDDIFWRSAKKRINFSEIRGTCLGYASKGTSGSGIGDIYKEQLLNTAKKIINAGITDPSFFELIGLIESGIGADRISDMVTNIILEDLLQYTKWVFKKIGIEHIKNINPFNGESIILVPKEILHELPTVESWSDIDNVCFINENLRKKVNEVIGKDWKDYTISQKKKEIKRIFIENPAIMREIIETYKKTEVNEYDFEKDPSGEVIWYPVAKNISKKIPLQLILPKNPSENDIKKVVRKICNQYKDLIENNGVNEILFFDGEPRNEKTAQRLFFAIAYSYCEANNLDLSPETNSGRGPIDFKLSSDCLKSQVLFIESER
jgi:hypothetical protein